MRIRSLRELLIVASCRRSVTYTFWGEHLKFLPAAFVINWQGRILDTLFENGLYIYESENTK